MITNPKYGWCKFKLGNFEGNPSYLTDVPVDILNAFIDYHTRGQGIVWFDEEGTEFTLILNPYSLFIIEERGENPILHDFSEIKLVEIEKELINDIEKDIDKWAQEFVTSDDEKEIEQHKKHIKLKIELLKKHIKE